MIDPEDLIDYTPEQLRELRKRARAAAKRERDTDPNRTDPKGVQGRMDSAVHELRVAWGLEKA